MSDVIDDMQGITRLGQTSDSVTSLKKGIQSALHIAAELPMRQQVRDEFVRSALVHYIGGARDVIRAKGAASSSSSRSARSTSSGSTGAAFENGGLRTPLSGAGFDQSGGQQGPSFPKIPGSAPGLDNTPQVKNDDVSLSLAGKIVNAITGRMSQEAGYNEGLDIDKPVRVKFGSDIAKDDQTLVEILLSAGDDQFGRLGGNDPLGIAASKLGMVGATWDRQVDRATASAVDKYNELDELLSQSNATDVGAPVSADLSDFLSLVLNADVDSRLREVGATTGNSIDGELMSQSQATDAGAPVSADLSDFLTLSLDAEVDKALRQAGAKDKDGTPTDGELLSAPEPKTAGSSQNTQSVTPTPNDNNGGSDDEGDAQKPDTPDTTDADGSQSAPDTPGSTAGEGDEIEGGKPSAPKTGGSGEVDTSFEGSFRPGAARELGKGTGGGDSDPTFDAAGIRLRLAGGDSRPLDPDLDPSGPRPGRSATTVSAKGIALLKALNAVVARLR